MRWDNVERAASAGVSFESTATKDGVTPMGTAVVVTVHSLLWFVKRAVGALRPRRSGRDEMEDDWSCPHGGRWIGWPGGWMQVVVPMRLVGESVEAICDCRPPGNRPKQPVTGDIEDDPPPETEREPPEEC